MKTAWKGGLALRPPKTISARMFPFSPRDLLVTVSILICAAGVCILLRAADTSEGFASPSLCWRCC